MARKILVAYATKAGSTEEIARFIGATLRDRGYAVDILSVNQQPDPAPYDAVLLGSAIRAGQWLPEAVTYLTTFRDVLAQKRLLYWTVCLTLEQDTPANRAIVSDYLKPVRAILPAQAEGFFAGVMDHKRLSLPLRMLVKAMKAPVGDFRKWDDIRAWLDEVEPLLQVRETA
ncbi:MAG: flavodoxin domain-containing protein [Anaerolineae bacterium]